MHQIAVDVAIIGAGTSGCFIASLLHEAGYNCTLIEKSRGLGGRCSRRRVSDNGYSVDLGASEFTANNIDNAFLRKKLSGWLEAGYLIPWQCQVSLFDAAEKSKTIEVLCASPSMNTWHKKIAGHINTTTGCKVHSLKKEEGCWRLLDESGQLISLANKVIVTSPAEQAFELLKDFEGFNYCHSASANSLSQYVCAVGFTEPLNVNADIFRGGHKVLASAICENNKPARSLVCPISQIWLLHSTHEWARQNSASDHQQTAIEMTDEFCRHFDAQTEPKILTSHYWRLARHHIEAGPKPNFIWHDELQIGCCGDWLDSADIAGALNSSLALFEKLQTLRHKG